MYSHCFQNAAELCENLSGLPAKDHIPVSQNMFALAIKGIAQASFGIFFDNDIEVLRLRRNYDIVSILIKMFNMPYLSNY